MKRSEGVFVTGGLLAAFALGTAFANMPLTQTFEGTVTGAMGGPGLDPHTTDVIVTDKAGHEMAFDVTHTPLYQRKDGMSIGAHVKATFTETMFDAASNWAFRPKATLFAGHDKIPKQFTID
jgi:hypothetical protein